MCNIPARREDYIAITGEERFHLFFCATRWVEETISAVWLVEIWNSIIKIVSYWEKVQKSKQTLKSFLNTQQAVNDQFSVAKFQFFNFLGSIFKLLLTKYQTSCIMLPYMHDMNELVRNVLQVFVKYGVIEKCKTAWAYKQTDLLDKSNILK